MTTKVHPYEDTGWLGRMPPDYDPELDDPLEYDSSADVLLIELQRRWLNRYNKLPWWRKVLHTVGIDQGNYC